MKIADRIQALEAKVEAHHAKDCPHCRLAIETVDAPACWVLVQLTREIREIAQRGRR